MSMPRQVYLMFFVLMNSFTLLQTSPKMANYYGGAVVIFLVLCMMIMTASADSGDKVEWIIIILMRISLNQSEKQQKGR